jgi:hypothetical protein
VRPGPAATVEDPRIRVVTFPGIDALVDAKPNNIDLGEKIMTKRASPFLAAISLVALAGVAAAKDNKGPSMLLRGDYAVTGSNSCIQVPSQPGFNPATLAPLDGGQVSFTVSVQDIHTFNGDGTGSIVGTNVSTVMTIPVSASSNSFTAPFTYKIDPDGTVTEQTGEITGTVLSGSTKGETLSVVNTPPLKGHVTDAGDLVLATAEPGIETVTHFNANGSITRVDQRICWRSRVLLRINH